jgi:very-short-patch-repair endonuclease
MKRSRALRSFARTRRRTGFDSKFEAAGVGALRARLPRGGALQTQFPVPPYRLDAMVTHPAGFRFAVEFDGPGHYDGFTGLRLREPAEQFARDRAVEAWCLAEGVSLFRVPYSYARRQKKAAAYVLAAAVRDFLARRPQVHYLDYTGCYYKINQYAAAVPGVERVRSAPDATFPFVNVRGA